MLLVWVRTTRGPTPQKWHQDQETPGRPPEVQILAYYPIPRGQEHLPLSELAESYQYVDGS
jgi:hypothetical protein